MQRGGPAAALLLLLQHPAEDMTACELLCSVTFLSSEAVDQDHIVSPLDIFDDREDLFPPLVNKHGRPRRPHPLHLPLLLLLLLLLSFLQFTLHLHLGQFLAHLHFLQVHKLSLLGHFFASEGFFSVYERVEASLGGGVVYALFVADEHAKVVGWVLFD